MIENEPNELTLIYHSDKPQDKKARAFIETVAGYKVKTLDLKKESLTETQLAEIANKMNVSVRKLIDPTYKDQFQSKDGSTLNQVFDNDLLTILRQEPILINTPITIIGKMAYEYESAYELLTKTASSDGVNFTMAANKEERPSII